jgi:RHH-type rel operon transcriptional repressor/antitoxin RelB
MIHDWRITIRIAIQFGFNTMITLRLDPNLEKSLTQLANQRGVSKSEIIRKSLALYMEQLARSELSPWELGKDLFGKHGSGDGNLSSQRKQILSDRLKEKHGENPD